MRKLLPLVLLAALTALSVSAPAQAPSITVQRMVVPAVYTAGQDISVTVTITKNDTRAVTAIALQDTVPGKWTYLNVSSTNPTMTPLKGQDIPNADGTKTLSFYYVSIPTFPITFTYRVTTGTADLGALGITGFAKFRFTGAEEQSPIVATPVVANAATEGEPPTEGETGTGTGGGCSGCNQTAKDFGGILGDIFAGGLAFITLMALSRRRG